MKRRYKGLLVLVLLTLYGCSWVKVTPQGDKVRVLTAQEVTGCKLMGKTTVNTTGKVGFLERHEHKVKEELDALARNSAPEIGGDTVVPVGEPELGRQVYEVYRCMPEPK